MKLHRCSDCTHEIVTHEFTCRRCLYGWKSRLDRPRRCPQCNSPYWDRERLTAKYSGVYAMKPGDSITVDENIIEPVSRVVAKLRKRGWVIADTYTVGKLHLRRIS